MYMYIVYIHVHEIVCLKIKICVYVCSLLNSNSDIQALYNIRVNFEKVELKENLW